MVETVLIWILAIIVYGVLICFMLLTVMWALLFTVLAINELSRLTPWPGKPEELAFDVYDWCESVFLRVADRVLRVYEYGRSHASRGSPWSERPRSNATRSE